MADVTAPQFQEDVNNTADWANGDENTTVTMRLGQQADSPAKTINDIKVQAESLASLFGYNPIGLFADGFTYTNRNDVGIDSNGDSWIYTGTLPFVVSAGTVPSEPTYKQVVYDSKTTYATTSAMQSATDIKANTVVHTQTFDSTVSNGGGASYYVSATVLTPNNRTTFTLQNGLYATLKHDGTATVQQANVDIGDDVSLGLALTSLKSVGVKNIIIPNKRVTFNGTFDAGGINIFGNDSVYATGTILNANLYGIKREATSNKFLDNTQSIQPITTKSRQKILVKTNNIPLSGSGTPTASSPLGENYCVISPSSYSGCSMFFLANGLGDGSTGNLGAPFDRMRVIKTYLAENGVICQTEDSTTGTVTTTSFDYLNIKYNETISDRWTVSGSTNLNALQLSAGATATYTVEASRSRCNVAVYTSALSATAVTISVNGQDVKTFSARDLSGDANKVKIVEFDMPATTNKTNEIVISTGGTLYLFGVGVYDAMNIPAADIEDLFKYSSKIIMHSLREMTYQGTGASIDSVIVDSNGDFGGSFHGGDLADNAASMFIFGRNRIVNDTSLYTEANATLRLNVGEFIVSQSLTCRYQGVVQAASEFDYRHAIDFGIDGGANYTAWYTANGADVDFRTIYTGMHSTSRNLLNTPTRVFNITATGSTFELKDNEQPLHQFGGSNQQMIIMPSFTGQSKSSILGRLWDDTNYLKYYYTPIENTGTIATTLQDGQTYSFSCLYQYGSNIL